MNAAYESSRGSTAWQITLTVLLFALAVRGGGLWLEQAALLEDPDAYRRLAINWSRSGVLGIESSDGSNVAPTAYRPPLYPWLLSLLVFDGRLDSLAIGGLHLFLGLSTVGLTLAISRRLQQAAVAWVPAVAVAIDPILLRQSQLVMTETLATFLAVLSWWLWLRIWPIETTPRSCSTARSVGQWLSLFALGVIFGLSILARPTAAAWLALFLLGGLAVGCRCWKRRINDGLILGLLAAAVVTPWTLRNLAVFSKPIWATTHGGYTLLLANNPLLFAHFREHGPSRNWDAEPFHAAWSRRGQVSDLSQVAEPNFWFAAKDAATLDNPAALPPIDELTDDKLAYQAAWATIAEQPGIFLVSSIYRMGWLWALYPAGGSVVARSGIGMWYGGMFLLAAGGLLYGVRRVGLRAWLLPATLVVSLTVVHAVYWSNMRMRAPLMPVVYVTAADAVLQFIARRHRHRY